MTQRSLSAAALLLLLSLPALLHAQETTGIEEERMKALLEASAQNEQWFGPRNKITIGFRFLTSGGKVNFGNLGTVPAKVIAPASAGAVDRVYDNGEVGADSLRPAETNADGTQSSTPGGRYATYITLEDGTKGEQNGEYLSFTPGQTRKWQENTEDQFTTRPGYVGFTNYSTTSEGARATDKAGPAAGVEMQFSHDIGRLSRRIQWGFTAGITLNGINSKSAGIVTATLNSHTDYYAVIGNTPIDFAPASGPVTNVYQNPDSGQLYDGTFETTVPLSQTPDETLSENKAVAGGAQVNGNWQVKGAYFMVKFGPSFHTQFNDRLELTGSAGFAGAYAGTTYTATESFSLDALPGIKLGVADPQVSYAKKFLTGYYADLTLEWAANDVTGLFGGLTAQQLTAYDQQVASRTAKIDLGSTVGVRGGISIKF